MYTVTITFEDGTTETVWANRLEYTSTILTLYCDVGTIYFRSALLRKVHSLIPKEEK